MLLFRNICNPRYTHTTPKREIISKVLNRALQHIFLAGLVDVNISHLISRLTGENLLFYGRISIQQAYEYACILYNLFCSEYRSNCAENIRKHILHTGKHEGVKMYNCPKCEYGTNIPVEFRNHLKELHPDIENPDLAYLHAGKNIFYIFI